MLQVLLLLLSPLLLVAAAAAFAILSKRLAFVHARSNATSSPQKTVTIGVFHPYANGGGGGERVLYCALLALVDYFKKVAAESEDKTQYKLQLVLYAGDDGLSTAELVARGAEAFNLPELKKLRVDLSVTLVPLPSREILDPKLYPSFTLFWQSVAHIRLTLEAMEASVKSGIFPHVWVDTTGCPFSYVAASIVYACTVVAYVHYPMISTDMIAKVQQRDSGFNNDAAIAASSSRSTVKYIYYRLIAGAYGLVGKYCTDVAMVNSTWTYNHIKQLWGKSPAIVYPPCGAMQEYMDFSLENRESLALSISQFRPEKNQLLQLQAFQVLLTKYADKMQTKFRDFRLVLLGSCRNADDEARVETLKQQAQELGITDRVDFVVNASFAELKRYLAKSSIGVHTMYNEHFGISNVEMMAAGMLVVANNSGGPKADIVKPGTGYLALTAEEYADKMLALLNQSPVESVEMRATARKSSLRFSDSEFGQQFIAAMSGVLEALLVMEEHKQSLAEIFADLGSDPVNGMTSHGVVERQESEGLNRLTPPKQTPEIVKYIRELTGLFSLLLWVGGALCIIIYGLQGDPNNLYLGIVLFLVVVITGTFSYFENAKSSNLMESFKQMMPTVTTVIREGKSQKIEATQLVRGDIIVLKGGDKVPADIRVLECSDDMTVDNSCLTGEPEPLKRVPDCTDENPLETKNLCFFGTFIPQGSGKGVVVRVGDKTVMGRIAKLATTTGQNMTPIAREINHFVHIIAVVAVVIGVIFFIIGIFLKTDIVTNVVFMIGIIVANVPEGLLATVTVCLSLAANRMAHKSVLVKNLEGVETLGSTSCICSDKTGTLTQNVMTVAHVVYDNKIFDAECSITPVGNYSLESPSFKALQRCATLCNNAVFDEDSKYEKAVGPDGLPIRGKRKPFKETVSMGNGTTMEKVAWDTIGDASESAMIKFCHDKKDIIEFREENSKIKEIPFNSKNKYQLSLHKQDNDGSKPILMVMKGAPERITARCGFVLIDGEEVEMTPKRLAEVEAAQLDLSKKGMRVLGFAQKLLNPDIYTADYEFSTDNPNFPIGEKDVDYEAVPKPDPKVEEPLCFIGLMALIDPPRPEVPIAVAKCKTAGIRVIMVTGDHPITAKAIAHKVGILWGPTCEDLEEENAARGVNEGDNGWVDPKTAPAIVVPGWTISLDTPVEEWDRILDHRQIVFARTSPQQKLIIVENCQRRKEIVAVTGDGVNDSPALKKADIGIAMGIMGSAVSKEAADMILLDDNFASIVCGVEEGRIIFDNLKKSIAYALAANIPELVPFLLYATVRLPLPLTTVLMLLICLGTDMIPSIAMAYEGAENDIMLRAPRNAETEHLVTKKLVFFAYALVGIVEAGAGMFTFLAVMNDYGYSPKILPNLGFYDRFGKQVLWCQTEGGHYCTAGGKYKNDDGDLIPLGKLTGNDTGSPQCQAEYDDIIPTGGDIFDTYIFYDPIVGGKVIDCQFPLQNLDTDADKPGEYDRKDPATYKDYTASPYVTFQSMQAARSQNYYPYYPMAARRSSFFDREWFDYDAAQTGVPGLVSSVSLAIFSSFQPLTVWAITDSDETGGGVSALGGARDAFGGLAVSVVDSTGKMTTSTFEISDSHSYKVGQSFEKILNADGTDPCTGEQCLLDYRAGFARRESDKVYLNIVSRMMQYSTLAIAQTAFFIAIVEMQWSNVMICKTRYLSIVMQGMTNSVLNFGLMFEFMLCAVIAYAGFTHTVLGTDNVRLVHWFPALPFAIFLAVLDEARKFLMRSTSRSVIRKDTGQMLRYPGWLEVNTYY
ncbi:hypothetical protein BBP00_00002846 [Phytophthora kernoviae]|uniref:GDP-Man:Man(3)GlcNAc(2)-PP-Dol alpha-1,2-mannosyltransferase n=1 Tax=Phytophthora kernoviae TaxID=325452 RepID=A0A3F2RX42_9STRA|nr:hypothetical protein BBP00_00002846 [Phytophthora kernoviae]